MSPQLETCRDAFVSIRAEAAALAESAPAEAFNARPGPDRWSAAECFEHLNTVGRLMMPGLDEAIRQGRARGRTAPGPFRYGPISRWFIAMQAPGTRKIPTPPLYRPAPSNLDKAAVMDAFLSLQDAFVERLAAADGLDLKGIIVRSPITPLLRLSLGAWFDVTTGHERRHLLQARRALEGHPRPLIAES